jgi:hypothetical protein
MNTKIFVSPHRLIRWLTVAPAVVFLAVAATSAQTAVAPAATDPATLAKYDTNKNGKIDIDELAAMQADEAKLARSVDAAPAAAPAAREEIVELSPFEVNAGSDKGYSASSSLSGTRLNSKLEDVASSLSVVTKQQLQDTAALDINDIFLYEVGTEGTGQYTDMSGDGKGDYDNASGNPNGANRMRGLSSADISVGGFSANSSIPIDTYNIDSVEISRGSNSNLAGLGQGGGTVNLTTSRANVTRESSKVEMRADSYGGFRASIDLNRPIIKNKLSFRFSAVYNETGYVRKPSVDRTNRQQFALTYKPFSKTTLTGSFEGFHEYAQRANTIMPRETISLWNAAGQPSWDPVATTYTVNGVSTKVTTTASFTALPFPQVIGALGSSNVRILEYIDNGQINYLMHGVNPVNATVGTSALQQFLTTQFASTASTPLFKIPQSTDQSIYDWTKYNIGASGYQRQQATTINLNLEQAIFNTQRQRLDYNVAFRREDSSTYRRQFIGQSDGVGMQLNVDVNTRLLDGRPNPFFGRPFIGGVNPQVYINPSLNENYRHQFAYQLDFRRDKTLLKWLGFHRVAAYQEYRVGTKANLRYHDTVIDSPDFLGTGITAPIATTNLSNSAGAMAYPLFYFGNTKGGGLQYANTGPVNWDGKFNTSYLGTTSTAWNTADPVTIDERYFSGNKTKNKLRTAGASVQSYWLNDQVVTTFGRRRDRNYNETSIGTTLNNGFYDLTNLNNFGTNKQWRFGDTTTKGVVVKPFLGFQFLRRLDEEGSGFTHYLANTLRGLNFHYNTSDSFQPADTAYNNYLVALPNPTNQSKEYGFSLNLLDNRVNLRVTHQETTQSNARTGTGIFAARLMAFDLDNSGLNYTFGIYDLATGWMTSIHPDWSLAQSQTAAANIAHLSPDFLTSATNKTISDTSDAVSQGWELELGFNPSRFWTLRVTGRKQEAVDQNISFYMQKWMTERLPIWKSIIIPTDLLPDGTQVLGAGLPWWTTRNGSTGTPADYFTTNVQAPLNLAIASQGKRRTQDREYSSAIITNYQLAGIAGERQWLKNATVGGAFRWASKAAIGYGAGAPDSDGIVRTLDKNKIFFDNGTRNFDLTLGYNTKLFNSKIRTRFQLNVRNVTESGHLQGYAVNPDGNFSLYRIVDPRQFILTTSFDL